MELRIQYVNKIKDADIKLNGLTVIAGPNSSGKSTVGRTLFSIVKAIANANSIKEEKGNDKLLTKHLESFYSRIQGLSQDSFNSDLSNDIPKDSVDFLQQLRSSEDVGSFLDGIVTVVNKQNLVPRQKKLLLEDLRNIRISWTYKEDSAANLRTELQYLIESEFMNTFCSGESGDTFVELKSEGKKHVNFTIKDNAVDIVSCNSTSFIEDATYVETSLYVHLMDAIMAAKTWRETEGASTFLNIVPSHIKDMAEKVMGAARRHTDKNKSNGITETILSGELKYDSYSHQLIYQEGTSQYTMINVASGIKSLGIIQLLESAKVIGPNRLLIWDEPENHLHPEWQIVFAEKLVKLAKDGVPILVTTHSPYFLQAIRYHSAREEMGKYINYYTPEEDNDHLATMVDVTRDLTPIFAKLAQPMNQIMDIVDYK